MTKADLGAIAVDIDEPSSNARSTTLVDAHIGMKIRIRRIELDMSRDKLGARLGLTAQQVQKYERGTNRVGAGRLLEISNILDVPVMYFFDGIQMNGGPEGRGHDFDALSLALDDASTVRLLRMFAKVRDPRLKSRVVNIVEAVVQGN